MGVNVHAIFTKCINSKDFTFLLLSMTSVIAVQSVGGKTKVLKWIEFFSNDFSYAILELISSDKNLEAIKIVFFPI